MNKLAILIATVNGREHFFNPLKSEFERQIKELGLENEVCIVEKKDNKEMSIGLKRQWLLDNSKSEYIVFFDDDDLPFPYYLAEIMKGINKGVDCIGLLIHMTTNGRNPQTCCHSLRYKKWENRRDGYDYVRNVTHFNPVKRSLAEIIGFEDKRFGEDQIYSDQVTTLCKTEHFINNRLFHYRYIHQEHNTKYGIK